jgi:hypothetical protein
MAMFKKNRPKNKQDDTIRLGRFWMVTLFTCTLVFSMLYSLPARWVISQPMVQKQIPQQWLIEAVEGSVWNGEMALSTHITDKSGAILNLGLLNWDLDWLPLFKANIGSQQKWILTEGSQVDFYIEKEILSAEAPLFLSNVRGNIDIAQLIQHLSVAGLQTLAATGQMVVSDIDVALDPLTLWPQEVSGQFELRSLSSFGINIAKLTVVPSMVAQTLLLSLSAQENGWKLTGRVSIKENHTYDITLSVKADSAQKMPDWSQLMVQKTPTSATFINQGKW